MLRSAGLHVVTLYEEYGDAESRIADPAIIQDCGFKGRVLLTGDQSLVYTWAKEIVDAGIAVFVTTDNNEGPTQWGPRIITAIDDVTRELNRRKKPFTARISKEGQITLVRIFERGEWTSIPIRRKKPSPFHRKK